MLQSIHHVQITIPEGAEPEARAFYGELLGLTELARPVEIQHMGGLWYQLGELQLHLGVEDHPYREQTRAHVAYLVNDLTALRARLEAAQITIFENTQIKGYQRFDVRDPFGNRLELMERVG